MTEDFTEAVERHNCEHPGTECIDPLLTSLFNDLKEQKAYTYKITQKLGINNVYEQRDAAEYYEKILGLTSPDASEIFHGLLTHKTTCSACCTETDTDGAFWHLSLALVDYNEHYSVVNGIEEYFRASDFSGENQMYCDECGAKSDATIKCVIKRHPEVLMLLLKRFEFDYRCMTYVKINRTVDVPHTLQIPENQAYELYAVVEHFGDLRSGHYTATIKSQEDGRWYNFNDATVTLLDNQPFQLHDFEKSSSAYLLFYRKKKVHPPDTCSQDIRVKTTPGVPTGDTSNHGQDAAEGEECEKGAEADNNTTAVIDKNEETGNKDLVSVQERSTELGVSSDLYVENQEVCNEERNDLSYRLQRAHAERPRDEGKTVMDDEDIKGNAEAKDSAVKRKSQIEESVADQEHDSGRRDDVRHKRPLECLEGDDIANASCNHQKYKQEVSNMHERREYPHQVCVDMQRDEEGMVINVNRERGEKMEGEQTEMREIDSTKCNDEDTEHQVNEGLDDVRQNMNEDQEGTQEVGQDNKLKPVSLDKKGNNDKIEINVMVDRERQTGADETGMVSGSAWLMTKYNLCCGDSKQNMAHNDHMIIEHKQAERKGTSERLQHCCQDLVYQNNKGRRNRSECVKHTTHNDVGAAEQQEKKRDNGEESSLRQPELVASSRQGDAQPKARTGYNEGAIKATCGSEKSKTYYVKITDEELKDGVQSITIKYMEIKTLAGTLQDGVKSCVEDNDGNAKSKSDTKTDANVTLSEGVHNLDLNDSPVLKPLKRRKHATKKKGEKKRKFRLHFAPYKLIRNEKKKRQKTTGRFRLFGQKRKNGDQSSKSD
ncbi:uncharacterized protein LOC117935145 isoform X2 [Etheostoma cragini]|nr:uncharacterized protein LOC117935145 isoform X2 [Etheostoma cragini]